MRFPIVVLVLMSCVSVPTVCAPQQTFSKTYGSSTYPGGVTVTPDSGFLVSGSVYAESAELDALVLKVNAAGRLEWKKSFGGKYGDFFGAALPISDGNFLVGGSTSSFGPVNPGQYPPADILLMKLNASGETIWSRLYGGPGDDRFVGFLETSDRGLIVLAESRSFEDPDFYTALDTLVLRLDGDGKLLWSTKLGTQGDDHAYWITQTKDKGFLIAGYPGRLIKLTPTGDVQWQRQFPYLIWVNYVYQNPDGSIILGTDYTTAELADGEIILIKMSPSGKILWSRLYGGAGSYETFGSMVAVQDGFVIVADRHSNDRYDVLLFQVNGQGVVQWKREFDGLRSFYGSQAIPTADGGFALLSNTPNGPRDQDSISLLKLTATGQLPGCTIALPATMKTRGVKLPSGAPDALTIKRNLPFTTRRLKLTPKSPSLPLGEFCH